MRPMYLLALALLPFANRSAHADTRTTFDVSATLQGVPFGISTGEAGTLVGNVVIDTTAGMFTAHLTAMSPRGTLTFTHLDGGYSDPLRVNYIEVLDSGSTASIGLALPVSSLLGYTGSDICSIADENCPFGSQAFLTAGVNYNGFSGSVYSGALTPAASSPEPATFALLTTGLLGAAARLRKLSS